MIVRWGLDELGGVLEQLGLSQPLRPSVEPQACLGGDDATAGAVEQLPPEALLECPHLLADCGLGDAEPGSGLGEALPFDHGAEGCELPRVH